MKNLSFTTISHSVFMIEYTLEKMIVTIVSTSAMSKVEGLKIADQLKF